MTGVLMVVLMSLSVANTVLFFIENLSEEDLAPARAAQPASTASQASESIDLASLNLFGRVREREDAQVVDAPETKLNLELQGVFTTADRELSTAIVAEGNKPGELYQIGDRLPGNAMLTDVFETYILIKRGDRVEKLMFEDSALREQSGNVSSTGNVSSSAGNLSSRASNVSADTRARLERVRQQIANRTREINRPRSGAASSPGQSLGNYVEAYKDRIEREPHAVLDELGVKSVQEGEAKGYRIGGDISHEALLRAGLQQGDVILSLNGQPVGNVANDRRLVDQALNAGRVRVEIQRGSRRFFLTVPIHR